MIINPAENTQALRSIFLAGTIDMGKSDDWQSKFIEMFDSDAVVIANPRREMAPLSEREIDEQIRWELHHIKKADAIFMNFEPGSSSPITLLELGLCLGMRDKKMVVVCPKAFYRYQNVKITVGEFRRHNLKFAETWKGGLEDFRTLWRQE
jgi:hypothetical protein